MIHHIVLRDTGILRAPLLEIINGRLGVWHKCDYPLIDRDVIIQRVKDSKFWKCYRLYDESDPKDVIARLSVRHSFRDVAPGDRLDVRLKVHGVYERYPTIRQVIKLLQRFVRVEDPRRVRVVDADFCEGLPWDATTAYLSIVQDRRFKLIPWGKHSRTYGTWRSGRVKHYDKGRERQNKNMPWPLGVEEFRIESGCPIARLARILGTTPPVTLLDLTGLMYEQCNHPFYMVRCYTMLRDPPRKRRDEFIALRRKLPEIGMQGVYDYTRIHRCQDWIEPFPLKENLALANRIWLRRFLRPLLARHFRESKYDLRPFWGALP